MKPVAEAANVNSNNSSSAKRYGCLAAVLVGVVFVLSMSSGSGSDSGENSLRTGQAKLPTTSIVSGSSGSSGYSSGSGGSNVNDFDTDNQDAFGEGAGAEEVGNPDATRSSTGGPARKSPPRVSDGGSMAANHPTSNNAVDEDLLDAEVEQAQTKFEQALKEQLLVHQPSILAKFATTMEQTRLAMTTVVSDNTELLPVTAEDVLLLGNQIEYRLTNEIQRLLEQQTNDLLLQEEQELEIDADLEAEEEVEGGEVAAMKVIKEDEEELLQELRKGVDSVVQTMIDVLIPERAGKISKELLASLLKDKTGKSYSVVLEKDLVVSIKKKSSKTTAAGKRKKAKKGTKKDATDGA